MAFRKNEMVEVVQGLSSVISFARTVVKVATNSYVPDVEKMK